jgi:hypothetical protein
MGDSVAVRSRVSRDLDSPPHLRSTDATAAIDSWLVSPVTFLGETDEHWDTLRNLLERGKVAGPRVHDARVAAICLQHAVEELWSADRDFSRFPALRVRNPLVPG